MRQASRDLGGRSDGPKPYDERTFRYLLSVEQRRSDRSGRPFVLIVVDLGSDGSSTLDAAVAGPIFSCLARCLRDTDFIGWYEDGHRAAAVLTELGEGEYGDVQKLLSEKVMARGLLRLLPSDLTRRLRIQVSRYPALERT